MKRLPDSDSAFVIRTDFSDQGAWSALCAAIAAPVGDYGFLAHVSFVDDAAYRDSTPEQLIDLLRESGTHTFVIVADEMSMSHPEHPLLVIDLWTKPGSAFRAVPTAIQAIENNLSISNMDFREFADAVDADGIFRGFGEP